MPARHLTRHLLLALTLLLISGCDSRDESTSTIEDTDFAASLDVSLEASTKTADGLYFRDLEEGTGEEAAEGDELAVYYSGHFPDGRRFDARTEGTPFTFTVGAGRVISGWDLGVRGMRVGGTRQLILPPELGYGDRQVGPIPPGSILVFEVELLDVR